MSQIFLVLCIPNFWLSDRHCELDSGFWISLCSCQYFWALFWSADKVIQNCILLNLAFKLCWVQFVFPEFIFIKLYRYMFSYFLFFLLLSLLHVFIHFYLMLITFFFLTVLTFLLRHNYLWPNYCIILLISILVFRLFPSM